MRWVFLFVCLLGIVHAQEDWQLELQTIDQQIQQLQEMREKLRMSTEKKANDALRWQFQNENYTDARRAWDQVALQKQQIQEIQTRIDQLESRKQEILRKHAG